MSDTPIDVHALSAELLEKAGSEHSGRAGRTLPHPVDGLRQTLIALRAGGDLNEHESPGAASLMVIRGRVRLIAGDHSIEVDRHQITPIPDERHSVHADEDSVLLLSVAVPQRSPDSQGARRNVGG